MAAQSHGERESCFHSATAITCRRGAAAAEFALILPLLLLLFFGSVQYGVLMFTYNSMLTTARNGARALAVGSATPTAVRTAVLAGMPGWVSPDSVTIVAGNVGADQVRTAITVPSAGATIMRLVPMPAEISVDVVMERENL
ncbi:TadE/TadG family type IV pilus assembly protein [Polymorphobacter sp.]|uniref:TadE/TadG family type IV pilus assembly protein n=1 Tax=Polymorphobacter sp. TaxID=1909290 RepID=UPI003F709DD9